MRAIKGHGNWRRRVSTTFWLVVFVVAYGLVSFSALTCHTAHAGQSSHQPSHSLLCLEACQIGFPLSIPSSSISPPVQATLARVLVLVEFPHQKFTSENHSSRAPPYSTILL